MDADTLRTKIQEQKDVLQQQDVGMATLRNRIHTLLERQDQQKQQLEAEGVAVEEPHHRSLEETETNSVIAGGDQNFEEGDGNVISGGQSNAAVGSGNTVGGGRGNNLGTGVVPISAEYTTVGGGTSNGALQDFSTIAGGSTNGVSRDEIGGGAFIGGGGANGIFASFSSIGGGQQNKIESNAINSFVGGGLKNKCGNKFSVVLGGQKNIAKGQYSLVVGGENNKALGVNSIAIGTNTQAKKDFAVAINLSKKSLKVNNKSEFSVRAESIFLQLGKKESQKLEINGDNIQNLIDILKGTTGRRELVQVRHAHQRNLISTLRGGEGASSTAQEEEEYENEIEFENLYQLYENQSQTIEDQQNDIDDLENYIQDFNYKVASGE